MPTQTVRESLWLLGGERSTGLTVQVFGVWSQCLGVWAEILGFLGAWESLSLGVDVWLSSVTAGFFAVMCLPEGIV